MSCANELTFYRVEHKESRLGMYTSPEARDISNNFTDLDKHPNPVDEIPNPRNFYFKYESDCRYGLESLHKAKEWIDCIEWAEQLDEAGFVLSKYSIKGIPERSFSVGLTQVLYIPNESLTLLSESTVTSLYEEALLDG